MTDSQRQRPEKAPHPNPLLDGIEAGTRPTGPVLAIVMALLLMLLGGGLGLLVSGDTKAGDGSFAAVLGGTLGSFLPALLLLFAWVRWKEGRGARTLGFQSPRAGRSVALGAALALVMFSLPVLLNVATGQLHFVARDGAWVRWAQLGPVLVLLLGFAVQGSTEEVFTRGYILQAVNRKWGLAAAIVAQVLFFDALHLANAGALHPVPVLNLTLISVFLAFWAASEGGLWAVCAFHGVWNWTQGNVYGIRVSGHSVDNTLLSTQESAGADPLLTGGTFGIEGSILVTVMLAIGSAFAYRAWRRRSRDGGSPPRPEPRPESAPA